MNRLLTAALSATILITVVACGDDTNDNPNPCDTANCGQGTCSNVDGQAVCSCLTLAAQADGRQVLTLEGLIKNGQPHPLMTAFADHKAVQCGYCTPGVIMTAYMLINDNEVLTDEAIRKGIEGNICRCTGYVNIVKAIKIAAKSKNDGLWW